MAASLLVFEHQRRTGIAINRAVEENASHKQYFQEWGPRRNRLTHSLIYEEFEMVLEDWVKLESEYELSKRVFIQMEEPYWPTRLNDLQPIQN